MVRYSVVLGVLLMIGIDAGGSENPAPAKQVDQVLPGDGDDKPQAEYLLFLPKAYSETGKAWPLMLFLHGRGESFGPLSLVKKWGPPKIAEDDQDFPYIVVSPQCPGKESWSDARQQAILVRLLDRIVSTFHVDTDRIYLTGLSMGGYGSWTLAETHADRFAAVVPICGGGKPEEAEKLKSLPIWAFHGDQDRAVPYSRSVEMVEAIRKAGGKKIKFTSYEGFGHNCWTSTYAAPDLYQWLNAQTRQNRGAE